ncbi:unnamed protein product [Rotaria sp. Silwood1]|nr:unnamed protein product [Rotaria sp. Silwood1]CAF1634370.1 unnamed protein product [Rotaria sp. Silwood1]CAF3834141.1 unnamed protein product [Rotaria sp. Silwood1]CAF3896713.1 unnamed protein product [Rotaria sp. Silwood1]CAF4836091.1 unnamed protein product [Rotaria sp. Silwood1]
MIVNMIYRLMVMISMQDYMKPKQIHVYPPGAQCASQPCQNGGRCFDLPSANTYHCACLGSYTGVNCQTKGRVCSNDICCDGALD